MVIIAREGQDIPFDIDVEPVRLADDAMPVILGLQNALYGVQRAVRTGDLDGTLVRLRERLAGDAHAQSVLNSLADSRDAVEVQLGAEALIERSGSRGMMLTLPVFPPAYPGSDGCRRLFHVTAFRKWSKPCEEVVRQTCVRVGIEYTIGYERLNPDILRAIWRDIATASLVVADLTCLNPNTVLELGIAHALGRPTLVLSRTPDLPKYLPVAKVRMHSYDTSAAGKQNLAGLLDRFFRDDPSIT